MAESRGGREDRRLKASFARLYAEGTEYVEPAFFSQRLTSSQLKVKTKAANVTGLQLGDLIAHPSFESMRCEKDKNVTPKPFWSGNNKHIGRSKILEESNRPD